MSTDAVIGWIVLWLGIALIPAFIARRKELGFWTFYVFALLLWIGAMVVVLVMKDRRRRCPHCAETIQREAHVCPHCQRELPGIVVAT